MQSDEASCDEFDEAVVVAVMFFADICVCHLSNYAGLYQYTLEVNGDLYANFYCLKVIDSYALTCKSIYYDPHNDDHGWILTESVSCQNGALENFLNYNCVDSVYF